MYSFKNTITFFLLFTGSLVAGAQPAKTFDIFTYSAPKNFILKENRDKLFYENYSGKNYCQLFLYPAVTGQSDIEKDFTANWNFFARNPSQGINDPETKEKQTTGGWDVLFGAARGSYNRKPFVLSLTTVTRGSITYYVAAVFTNEKYIPLIQSFTASVQADSNLFVRRTQSNTAQPAVAVNTVPTGKKTITKSSTRFDDGWLSTVQPGYVQVTKAGTELRLYYTDPALDDARPNTTDAPEYYWSKYVAPYYTVSNPQKWAGVQYPVIYFMEGDAINKQTGKPCYVAIKIVYSGGARPIVVIAPDQQSFRQQFPHPNDIDPKLNANRFAVTAADITGPWKGSGGGGVEYYNAYSGTYAGMSAVSTTDEFVFNSNGTYTSMYRSASMNNGGAQFGGQDFNGKYTVADWTLTATNRFAGKTTTFNAQLIAVKNGYLLYLADQDNPSMNYMLYKVK